MKVKEYCIDTTKYNVKERSQPDGSVSILLTPIKCNCKGCNKEIEWDGAYNFRWIDDDKMQRQGRFCRKCEKTIKQLKI